METQEAESVNTNVSNQKAVKPAKDSTNLVLGILCIILCAAVFGLLYMYMNLSSEYQNLNDKYVELTTMVNDTSAQNTDDTNKESDVTETTNPVAGNSTTMKNFSFVLSNPGSDAPDVKFTGKMPANLSVVPHEENTIKSAEILGTNFQMSFFEHYEDFWGTFDSFTEIDTANLGKLAFVENVGSTANYQYQKKYVSMNEFFKTEGQCESMGELVNAPCGPNMIYVTENNATKYLFVVSCNTNSQADFQTCHDIVKSIKFEEVN
ncbi:hypothetical protein KC660_02105 [Candidatus Dojkabacteria bacterium]|uniref:Uncharacterized protein n=1 Tax=Candidatus Dojkabacteria bacterium TaxID=2099670 RepID=A0A955L3D3_9BACT|nr:hypothetical protein [Candidatus Dojkabacteria bacterium]